MPSQVFVSNTGGFGPFQNLAGPYALSTDGTKLFIVVVDKTNNLLKVFKSTDTGATWAEADAGNDKAINVTAQYQNAASVIALDTIFIAYVHTDQTLRIAEFSMTTATWGAVHAGGPALVTSGTGLVQRLMLARRSNGDLVASYLGPDEVVGIARARTNFVIFSGGAYGAETTIGTGLAQSVSVSAMLLAASNRIHIFMNATNFRQQTLNADNSLGTFQDLGVVNNGTWFPGVYSPTTNLITILAGTTDSLVFEAQDAVNPVWNETDLTTLGWAHSFTSQQFWSAALDNNGIAYVFRSLFLSAGASNAIGIWQANKVGGIWNVNTMPVYGVFNDALPNSGQTTFSVSSFLTPKGIALAFDENPINGNAPNPSQMSFLLTSFGAPSLTQPFSTIALTFVLGFPSVRSCCFLCEQPKRTGLPFPILRDKSLSYARYNAST